MTFKLKHISALAAMAMFTVMVTAQPKTPQPPVPANVTIHASIDSTVVTMGDRTMLRVEVLKDGHAGAFADMPKPGPDQVLSFGGAEVRNQTVDSTVLPNGRTQINYNLLIQPFDPGTLQFPPFKYVVGTDTFYSERISLKVNEPEMPQEMRDSLLINPMLGTVNIAPCWYDFIPSWWYWLVIGIALVALGVVLFMLYKKNGPGLLPKRQIIPPYVVATRRLKKLKESRLAYSGSEKEYYTELTDIFRQYLGGRFGIFALEMPSSEILKEMSDNPMTKPYTEQVRPMLQTSDFVKFAKVRPTPDENIRSFGIVEDFVESTKPVEEDPDAKANESKKK